MKHLAKLKHVSIYVSMEGIYLPKDQKRLQVKIATAHLVLQFLLLDDQDERTHYTTNPIQRFDMYSLT